MYINLAAGGTYALTLYTNLSPTRSGEYNIIYVYYIYIYIHSRWVRPIRRHVREHTTGASLVRRTMNRRDYYINCTKEFAAADRIYPRGKSRRNFPSRAATRQPCILYNIYIYIYIIYACSE